MSELSVNQVSNPNPGWYRGDFHAHTNSSDGKYTPPELAALSKKQALDFFAITEHNTLDSYSKFGEDPGILVIPGLEVTLDIGHWNVFGMAGGSDTGWRDWMDGIVGDQMSITLPEGRTPTSVMEAASAQGLLNSINHPFLKPWEWQDVATLLRYIDCLEIWNDHLWPDNQQANPWAITFWTACLNAGYRITAIGGSDFHFLPGDHPDYPGEYMGVPTTIVGAAELSGAGILRALRQRRAYVTTGPQLAFTAEAEGGPYEVGAELAAVQGEIEFTGEVIASNVAASVHLVHNGRMVASVPVSDGQARLNYTARSNPDRPDWYRLEVHGSQGERLAISNPIFTGPALPPGKARFGDYVLEVFS